MTIRLLVLALTLFVLVPSAAFAAPSIRVISPNGGETVSLNPTKQFLVKWEASDVPTKSKVCIGVVAEGKTVTDIPNTFDRCYKAKNGKQKASQKAADLYSDIAHVSGKYTLHVTLVTETKINWQTIQTKVVSDTSDATFTIKPKADKNAGVLEIEADGKEWEAGTMNKKDATRACLAEAKKYEEIRCIWKGEEIYEQNPEKTAEYQKKLKESAEKDIKNVKWLIASVREQTSTAFNQAVALVNLVVADGFVAEAEKLFGKGHYGSVASQTYQARMYVERARDALRENR